MPTLNPSVNSNSDFAPLPIFDTGDQLKNLLLMLSRRPENQKYRATLRKAADEIREKAFGYNRQTTKRKILKLIAEFHICEIDDFIDETGIAESEIRAALAELAAEGAITVGRRRRWQEMGKHFNEIFELANMPVSDILS